MFTFPVSRTDSYVSEHWVYSNRVYVSCFHDRLIHKYSKSCLRSTRDWICRGNWKSAKEAAVHAWSPLSQNVQNIFRTNSCLSECRAYSKLCLRFLFPEQIHVWVNVEHIQNHVYVLVMSKSVKETVKVYRRRLRCGLPNQFPEVAVQSASLLRNSRRAIPSCACIDKCFFLNKLILSLCTQSIVLSKNKIKNRVIRFTNSNAEFSVSFTEDCKNVYKKCRFVNQHD